MPRYVALLRAINTPPRHVKMDRLRSVFRSLGFENVATYIASGNVIFDADAPEIRAIEAALEAELGFAVPVFLRTADEVIAAAERRPFGDAEGDLEISFLPEVPNPDRVDRLMATVAGTDRLAVVDREVYWMHSGPRSESGHSEAEVMRILGMPTTQRSARTVRRIADKFLS
jgi:uncharacterized protein (DUF1697 family)